jgi:hypothetical protein
VVGLSSLGMKLTNEMAKLKTFSTLRAAIDKIETLVGELHIAVNFTGIK